MSGGATAVMAAAAVAGAAIAYNNGQEQKKAAEKASQQAEANAGKHELPPAVEDVPPGKADHGVSPGMRSTTLILLFGPSSCSL